jgi:hypothetical protein
MTGRSIATPGARAGLYLGTIYGSRGCSVKEKEGRLNGKSKKSEDRSQEPEEDQNLKS